VPVLCRIRWVMRLMRWVNPHYGHYSLYLEFHSASPVPNYMGVEAGDVHYSLYLESHSASLVPNKMGVEAGDVH
jgi:hypothetical protein